MEKAPAAAPAAGASQPEGKTYKEMLRDGNYWLLWLIYVLGATGGMMIIGTAASISDQYQLVGEATLFVMLVSIANTFGRTSGVQYSDKIGRYPTVIAMFGAIAVGLLLTALFKGPGSILAILGVMMVALSFGGFLGSFPGITAENWGVTYVWNKLRLDVYCIWCGCDCWSTAWCTSCTSKPRRLHNGLLHRYRYGYHWYSTPTILYG